jgi:Tol biopolymer transport system component
MGGTGAGRAALRVGALFFVAVLAGLPADAAPEPHVTQRVSVEHAPDTPLTEADGRSWDPAITPDGRFVAFTSLATDLAPGTQACYCGSWNPSDIFLHDRLTGTTRAITTYWRSPGAWAYVSGDSIHPAVSGDGRYVAFATEAWELLYPNDTPGYEDIDAADILVRDTLTNKTTRPLPGPADVFGGHNGGDDISIRPVLSATGRYLAFVTDASNLVAGDTNGTTDVIWTDRDADADGIMDEQGAGEVDVRIVSVSGAGVQGNNASGYAFWTPISISGDGHLVAFTSLASNLVPGDINATSDVFVRDVIAGTTTLVSPGSDGASYSPSISGDGRSVAFTSSASNLVPGDTNGAPDVFARDLVAGTTTLVSQSSTGEIGDARSDSAAISADGTTIAFASLAGNLAAGDSNNVRDVFVRILGSGVTERVSVGTFGTGGDRASYTASLSGNGALVAFASDAMTFTVDLNLGSDIFVRDRATCLACTGGEP